jgi:hypothetical protein
MTILVRVINAELEVRRLQIPTETLARIILDRCDAILKPVLTSILNNKGTWDKFRSALLDATENQDVRTVILTQAPTQGTRSMAAYMADMEGYKMAFFYHMGAEPAEGLDWPEYVKPSPRLWEKLWAIGLQGVRDDALRGALLINKAAWQATKMVANDPAPWTMNEWQHLNLELAYQHQAAFGASGPAKTRATSSSSSSQSASKKQDQRPMPLDRPRNHTYDTKIHQDTHV